ncbi:MAG: hypothetical protein FDX30_02610 [Chlorobium sp.]|nr:MAG: hypothetical protein FDX30_02610 [Chlorobium sp.]
MKMTKALVAAGLAVMLGAGTASAEDGKIGLGYQGVFGGDPLNLNGVSARYWFNKNVGGELNVFYGAVGASRNSVNVGNADLFLGTAKVLYAPVVKQNSKFYVGLEGGYGSVSGDWIPSSVDVTLWTVTPFMGAEYSFAGLPELGLNFEVGYRMHHVDTSWPGTDLNIHVNGTFVSLGAHYYL